MNKSFVGFSIGRSWISKIVSFFQLGKSHAFIAFYIDHYENWLVVDSTRKGVKIHLMSEFAKHNKIIKKFNIESDLKQRYSIIDYSIKSSYKDYPELEIAGNLIQLIVRFFTFNKVKIKNPFGQGEKSPRCPEYVLMILRDIFGYKVGDDLDSKDLLWLENFLKKAQ